MAHTHFVSVLAFTTHANLWNSPYAVCTCVGGGVGWGGGGGSLIPAPVDELPRDVFSVRATECVGGDGRLRRIVSHMGAQMT